MGPQGNLQLLWKLTGYKPRKELSKITPNEGRGGEEQENNPGRSERSHHLAPKVSRL